ncbi:MAG: EAL domain-containing protein [Actinomycetota bacterium]|nr:EAL domain-containing protein [Actinomycetota bacterium]
MPVAEESELIVALGAWVIEEACAQIRRWHDAHSAQLGVRVSVNVSAPQLSPVLIETVTAALEENALSPSSLALEITESLLVEHTEPAREVLGGLEALGVAIVLDDFGTGYSSLRYLSSFHVSQLKLDRSFTADLAREARPAKIIAATIDMARALGMTVVAEGVETEAQLTVLRRLAPDYAQGFLDPGHGGREPLASAPAGGHRAPGRLVVPGRVGDRTARRPASEVGQPVDRNHAFCDGGGVGSHLPAPALGASVRALPDRRGRHRDDRGHDLGDRGRSSRAGARADLVC